LSACAGDRLNGADSLGEKPLRFMRGIVKLPVAYTLATVEPLMGPVKGARQTEILAEPPFAQPAAKVAKSIRNSPVPVAVMIAAKRM